MGKKKAKQKKKARRSIQAYAFVDTNIFLDFYRSSNETNLSLLEKLKTVKGRIICTHQVEMEFLKHRQTVMLKALNDLSADVSTSIPAVVSDDNIQNAIKKIKDDAKSKQKILQKRVSAILDKPSVNDPFFSVLHENFTSDADHVLTRDMDERRKIKRRAWKRFVLGYPPRKKNDTSIGDALNWEWIIHCAKTLKLKGRFYIVSRDGDYGCVHNDKYYLNDHLKREFRDRVGKKSIVYTHRLSDALKTMKVNVPQKEIDAETEALKQPPAFVAALTAGLERNEQDLVDRLTQVRKWLGKHTGESGDDA